MIFQSIFSFNFRPWICTHRSIRSKKIVAAAESQSTHLWNNFEVSIDIIGTCPAHVAAYSHVTSTSGKTFQDCKKALVYSQGYTPTVSFPKFCSRFAASVTPDTENACCHVSSLERSQTFWQQRAFIKKKKKKPQCWSRIKTVSSYCLNLHLHWLLSNGRRKSQRLMLPFDRNPSRKYGILGSPIRVTHRSSIILKRLQPLKWLFCWQ